MYFISICDVVHRWTQTFLTICATGKFKFIYCVFLILHLRALIKLVNDKQSNWDVFLEATLFSLRSKVQTTTEHSPFLMMYGREAVFPSEVPVDMPVSFRSPFKNNHNGLFFNFLLECLESSYNFFICLSFQLSTIILPEKRTSHSFSDEKIKSMESAENISKSQRKQKQAIAKRAQKKNQNALYHRGDEVLWFNVRKRGRMEEPKIEPCMHSCMHGGDASV